MKKLITILIVALLAVNVQAGTFVFTSLGISDLGKVGGVEGKTAKTIYVGVGQQKSPTFSLFATGGYSKHGFAVGEERASTGEITGGFAWTPVCIPQTNPLVKFGFVGSGGVGLLDMSEGDAINSSIALIGGLIGTYAFSFDANHEPIGKAEFHVRLVDTGDYEKLEVGVGVIWSLAQATK